MARHRILQITDTHVVPRPGLLGGQIQTLDILEDAIDRTLAMLPKLGTVDQVLVTGDISDDGGAESYAAFRDQIERLGLPYLLIPGNHDLREPLRAAFRDLDHIPQHGKIDWVHDLEDLRIIGLDTLVEGVAHGEVGATSAAFLSDALADAGQRPVLLTLHHPPFDTGIGFMDRLGLLDRELLAPILTGAANPVLIVGGHVHRAIFGSAFGHPAIIGPSVAHAIDADYRNDAPEGFYVQHGGFMLHDWLGGSFRSTNVSLTDKLGPFLFGGSPRALNSN